VSLDLTGFRPEVTEKVIRLLMVLDRMSAHPILSSRVCLHGGTALNLFVLGVPRLSVDIDLNYIGHPDREQMLADRPSVEQAVVDVATELGFAVRPGRAEHSGRSFRLQYQGRLGLDTVKVDLDYLNRSPLLPPTPRTVVLPSGAEVSFPLNSGIELIAGKLKALVERVAIRDLYDVNRIAAIFPSALDGPDDRLRRRILLYYLAKSDPYPRPFEVVARFAGRERDVGEALHPMLLAEDRPDLSTMVTTAADFLAQVSRPVEPQEVEYLARFALADFAPELLFADHPGALAAARSDPAAAWKVRNLSTALGAK
jgi:hypothetical protein